MSFPTIPSNVEGAAHPAQVSASAVMVDSVLCSRTPSPLQVGTGHGREVKMPLGARQHLFPENHSRKVPVECVSTKHHLASEDSYGVPNTQFKEMEPVLQGAVLLSVGGTVPNRLGAQTE